MEERLLEFVDRDELAGVEGFDALSGFRDLIDPGCYRVLVGN